MDLVVRPEERLRIGAVGAEAILQNIRMIVLTTAYSVPLDRAFAHAGEFVDSPSPAVTSGLTARLTEAIEEREPRVRVQRIVLEAAASKTAATSAENAVEAGISGRLYPHIYFDLKEGTSL